MKLNNIDVNSTLGKAKELLAQEKNMSPGLKAVLCEIESKLQLAGVRLEIQIRLQLVI